MRYENPVLRGFYPDPSVCRVDGGFTGVVLGLYACGNNRAEFTDFLCRYADS